MGVSRIKTILLSLEMLYQSYLCNTSFRYIFAGIGVFGLGTAVVILKILKKHLLQKRQKKKVL